MNKKIAFTLLLGFINSYTQGLTPFQFLPPFNGTNVAVSTAISLAMLGAFREAEPLEKKFNNGKPFHLLKLYAQFPMGAVEFTQIKSERSKRIFATTLSFLQVFLPAYFILGHLVFKSNDPKAEFEKIKRALHKLQAHVQEATFEKNGLENSPEKEIKKIFPDAKNKEAREKALLKTLKRIHSMEKALNALTTEKFTESSELTNMQKKLTHLKLYFEALQNTLI